MKIKYKGSDPLVLAIAIIFTIALVISYPIALIWALNVLFGLKIPLTFETWIAGMVIVSLFCTNSNISSKEDKEE